MKLFWTRAEKLVWDTGSVRGWRPTQSHPGWSCTKITGLSICGKFGLAWDLTKVLPCCFDIKTTGPSCRRDCGEPNKCGLVNSGWWEKKSDLLPLLLILRDNNNTNLWGKQRQTLFLANQITNFVLSVFLGKDTFFISKISRQQSEWLKGLKVLCVVRKQSRMHVGERWPHYSIIYVVLNYQLPHSVYFCHKC